MSLGHPSRRLFTSSASFSPSSRPPFFPRLSSKPSFQTFHLSPPILYSQRIRSSFLTSLKATLAFHHNASLLRSTLIEPRSQSRHLSTAMSSSSKLADTFLAKIKPVRPTGKYPAKAHARKVVEIMKRHRSEAGHVDGIALAGYLYLEGQKSAMHEDCDQAAPFRQRRYFYYLTGCELPDCYAFYNIAADWLTLFIPPVDAEDVMWSGLPLLQAEALEKYDIDECITTDKLNQYLSQAAATANATSSTCNSTVYTIDQQLSDHVQLSSFSHVSVNFLRSAVEESRVVKDDYELGLIRYANEVSSIAHINVIRSSGTVENEAGLEAVFLKTCVERHCRKQAYDCICASGTSAATLHYVTNDAPIYEKLNVLVDAGGEYNCYASDITRTVPLHGKPFTKETKEIYTAVEEMQDAAFGIIKAGVVWDDVHLTTHRVAIRHLLKLGILCNGTEEELFDSGVSAGFFPHGLGHYMGMDTHDCGGKANYSDPNLMLRYLRVRGPVPEGAVITVEPGLYFSRHVLKSYLEGEKTKQYIDQTVLDRYWSVGGIRIEDDIVVTKDGYENMTKVPRAIEDIEALVREGLSG